MKKILTLIFVILTIRHANGQYQYIAPNTDYQLGVTDGSIFHKSGKSYDYVGACWPKNPLYTFKYNFSWPVDIYSTTGHRLYSSFGAPVNSFSARLFHNNTPYYIIINQKDTIAIVKQQDRSDEQIESIVIRDFLSGEIEKYGDTILLCSPTAGLDLTHYTSVLTNVLTTPCSSYLNESYNYQFIYYINNKTITTKYINATDLKDGDTLQLAISALTPISTYVPGYVCNCATSTMTFKSNKFLIRKGTIGSYHFPYKTISICPGDTVFPFKANTTYTRLIYKTIDDTDYKDQYPTQFSPQFYKPVIITGDVYDKGRGYCWSKADTVRYVGSPDCNDGYISGSIFYDVNNNRKKDVDETSLSNKILEIQPGNRLLFLPNGTFKGLKLPLGEKYTLTFSEEGWETSNVQLDLTRKDTFQYYDNVNIPAVPSRENDLQIEITADRMRPGFGTTYYIDIKNNSKETIYYFNADLYIDTNLTNITYSSAPVSVSKNKIRWLVNSINGQTSLRYIVNSKVPANASLLNKEIVSSTEVLYAGDKYTLNNKDTARTIVTGSFDPNDKQVFSDNGQQKKFISASSDLEYLIRFQNTGTDTAFTVKVIDTLSPEHAPGTLKMLAASHNYELMIENGNIFIWTFKNILLPDSNVNEPKSHGFIKFSIKQKEGNPDFTTISNKASIYFDYNEPIITNKTEVVIGSEYVVTGNNKYHLSTSELQLFPNPARDQLNFNTPCSFEIESLCGQKIMKAENVNSINISNFHKGVYILKTSEGHVKKFIVE